jgi:TetR/AcrR family transcriptional regulator
MVGQYTPNDGGGDTRESLLDAATEAFAGKGFSGARVDEIADRAKANKAMIYYHFGSKEGLYKAVLLRRIAGMREAIGAAIADVKDPLTRLRLLYRGLGCAFGATPALPYIVVHEMLGGGTHMDEEVAGAFKGILDLVRAAVREGVECGSMRPVEPIFVHFMMIAPLLLFGVSRPFRERVLPVVAPSTDPIIPERFREQLDDALTRLVSPRPASTAKKNAKKRRRTK